MYIYTHNMYIHTHAHVDYLCILLPMRGHKHPHDCKRLSCQPFLVLWYSVMKCCSVLQCVAVYCSALHPRDCKHYSGQPFLVLCCSVLQRAAVCCNVLQYVIMYCSVLQSVSVCCNVLRCVAVRHAHMIASTSPVSPFLSCSTVYCSVLQCAAVYCRALQCVAPV